MESGKIIRDLREERFLRPTDIERMSRAIADARGSSDFYVPHSTLADIESGAVPSIYKLFSLAACFRVPLDELMLAYGIHASEVTALAPKPGSKSLQLQSLGTKEPSFRFRLNFDRAVNLEETTLLGMQPEDLALLPPALQGRADFKHFRYAVMGFRDTSMGALLPPGSLVEVDINQNRVEVFTWLTLQERPIYLVWHPEGHSCCWCQLDGKELFTVPHPQSHYPIRRFKMPGEATVVGRIVNAWIPFALAGNRS
jgi:hypothetical protein